MSETVRVEQYGSGVTVVVTRRANRATYNDQVQLSAQSARVLFRQLAQILVPIRPKKEATA